MQLHELACSSLSFHAVSWTFMKFNELTWACMQFPELSWSSMSLHELVCSSFLCLSSSQESCSACFNFQGLIIDLGSIMIRLQFSYPAYPSSLFLFYNRMIWFIHSIYTLVISCLFMFLLDHSQAAESNNSFFLWIVGSKMFKLYPSRDFTMNKK